MKTALRILTFRVPTRAGKMVCVSAWCMVVFVFVLIPLNLAFGPDCHGDPMYYGWCEEPSNFSKVISMLATQAIVVCIVSLVLATYFVRHDKRRRADY